jgi:hypothetical protein
MRRWVIVPIVEGQSEVMAVPVLLRRLLSELQRYDVMVARPVRVHRSSVVKEGEIERAVVLARRNRDGCDAVMILLDADDDCPAELGSELLTRIKEAHGDLSAAVVLAKREFEGWFLSSLESLRGVQGIVDDASSPPNPEDIRGAKERLSAYMVQRRSYLEITDQPALAAQFDLNLARQRCPSFEKFRRDFERLISLGE